jgi:hypothetical protein
MIGDYNVSNTLKSEAEPAEKGWGPCAWGGCRDRKPRAGRVAGAARGPSHTSRVAAEGGAAGQLLAAARPGPARPRPHRPGGGHPSADDLAGLEDLWDAPIAWDDPPALHRLERGLVEAEVKLSAYRRALHERIDACTAQLVDHYQRDPAQIVR